MDLKSTIDIILRDLKEARDIMDDLKNYPDVPEIQIELAKAKCRSAEQVLQFLTEEKTEAKEKHTPDHSESENGQEEHPPSLPGEGNKTIEDEVVSDIDSKDNVDVFEISDFEDEAEEKEEEIIDQIIQPESSDKDSDNTATEAGGEKKILADKFSRESSINEKIASRRHDSESDEVSKLKPVSNLSDAIGINDRFQYVRELFNGDQDLYKQTIISLNNASSIDDAFDILSKASKAEKDNQTFDQLLDLVKRKLRTI